jgi:hypothetical protein
MPLMMIDVAIRSTNKAQISPMFQQILQIDVGVSVVAAAN